MSSGCFDLLAADYDRTWTNSGAGRSQRDAVWRQLAPLFGSGDTVFDIGCGTGEDALYLARLGVRVSAIDASPAMARIAQSRGVSAEAGSIENIHALNGVFDGVISNFGALNCVPELAALRNPLARLIRPGGHLAICLMGRFCLSESLHFMRKLQFRKAARRWKGQTYAKRLKMQVYYPSASAVIRALTPEFRLVSRIGIGLAVPPSGTANLSPASLRFRGRIDSRIAALPVLRAMADHQLYIFSPPVTPKQMIILFHPRAVKPKNRRFPLAILAVAATLEGKENYVIVDGNLDIDPGGTIARIAAEHRVEMLAVSVMPGPQMVAAIPVCRDFRKQHPAVPIAWGGYFPSLYTDATLNARYVDFAIRGQGEDTLVELIAAIRGERKPATVSGLSYKDDFGLHVHNADRPLRSPSDFPLLPYHRLQDVNRYLLPTFLGTRTAVHQASIGCPFRCKFCGVVPIFDGKQKMESPERTVSTLSHLKNTYGANAIQFYDNNFFLNESHAREQAERMVPLGIRWWAEGRIDTVLKYSDETWRAIRRSGATMIFFGAESGSDEVLIQMNKKITTSQTLELAARIRQFDIIPEFSFVVGSPHNPEQDTRETIGFIRKLKKLNPDAEIIVQHYIPTPHPDGMYGKIDDKIEFPQTPEEWATERWFNFTVRQDPHLPWLPGHVKRRIDNFELVINSRWPTAQDIYLPGWGRMLLQTLSSWRYAFGRYEYPVELSWAQKMVALRKPRWESI